MRLVINGGMIVEDLMERHNEVEEILAAYGVEFIDDDLELSLRELADLYNIDVNDLIVDIELALQDDADWDEDWNEERARHA